MNLSQYFDRVVLINLHRRIDRLEQVNAALRNCDWPFKQPEIFEAIDGRKVLMPEGWMHGPGAWGAMLSHQKVLESACNDNVGRLLVLEDDVCFASDFRVQIERFLQVVPTDWNQLMIGGQHRHKLGKPELIKPGVYRCTDCERMHCYAIQGEFMRKFHERLLGGGKYNGVAHCDWILAHDPDMQASHKVYSPEFFLVGQERGRSDIRGAETPRMFWNPPGPGLSVINLHAPQAVALALRQRGFYGSRLFEHKSGQRQTLNQLFNSTTDDLTARIQVLSEWIKLTQWEVAADPGFVCTIWHPQATPELVKAASLWKVYEITADSVDDAIKQLPARLRGCLTRK